MRESLTAFDPQRFTELHLEVHAVLFETCPNPHILDLVHRGWNRMKVLRNSSFSFVPGRASESVEEHERILRLVEQGASPLDIELAAREHRTKTLDAVMARAADHKAPSRRAAAKRTAASRPAPAGFGRIAHPHISQIQAPRPTEATA